MQRKWNSEDGEVKIIPYIRKPNGEWSIPDEFWGHLWRQMEAEGTVEIVFSEGFVVSAEEFIDWVKTNGNLVTVMFIGNEPAVFGMLNGVSSQHAFGHFNVMTKFRGLANDLLQTLIYFYLKGKDKQGRYTIEVLIGLVPEHNIPAVKRMEGVGMTNLGTIPNATNNVYTKQREGLTILYLEREPFQRRMENGG